MVDQRVAERRPVAPKAEPAAAPPAAAPPPGGYAPPGAPPPGGGLRRLRVRHLGVGLVLVLAGALFATSARTADGGDLRGEDTDLPSLVAAREQQVAQRDAQLAALRAQVDASAGGVDDPAAQRLAASSAQLAPVAGLEAADGPGLVITLDDSPASRRDQPDGVDVDTLIVHQQDLQAVVNALWQGGAGAVGLQDQRVISTSAVRCVGNVLRLQGRLYAPPYTVRAVGDPAALRAALAASPAVAAYASDAARVGLVWDVRGDADVQVPAWTGALQLDHARVLDEAGGGPTTAP